MRRVGVGLGAFFVLALLEGCLVGRDLTYANEESVTGAATPASPVEGDGADLMGADASSLGNGVSDAGAKKDSGAKDAGADAKPPLPPGDCAPNTLSEVEPNDQAIQGTQLAAGTTACGTLIVGSDVDWFQFDLGQGGKTSIEFITDGDAYVVIAGLGNNGSYSGRNNFKTSFEGTGAFYVRIYSPDTKPQAYRITRE